MGYSYHYGYNDDDTPDQSGPPAAGAIVALLIMNLVGFICWIVTCRRYTINKAAEEHARASTHAWLKEEITRQLRPGENFAWQGFMGKNPSESGSCGKACAMFFLSFFTVLPIVVPTLVWIGIGVPHEPDVGFWMSTMMPSGFGVLFSLIMVCASWSGNEHGTAYGLTDDRAIILKGNWKKRTRTDLRVFQLSSLPQLRLANGSIIFDQTVRQNGDKATVVTIGFHYLGTEAETVYRLIVDRQRPGAMAGAGGYPAPHVGVAVAADGSMGMGMGMGAPLLGGGSSGGVVMGSSVDPPSYGSMRACTSCGATLDQGDRFCRTCGSAQNVAESRAPSAPSASIPAPGQSKFGGGAAL